MSKNRYLLACASVLACAVAASSAAAQTADSTAKPAEADKSYATGEIIVTAQKRQQSINDVGLTIQAASANSLADRGIKDVSDLGKLVPGFVATQSTFATPIYTLRGIGLYDSTIGASPAVAIYTDEISRNYPIMSDALNLDIERVEVLKGPQGTLFGQSSTGGAINYIVAKPTDTLKAGFDASIERFDKVSVSGYVSGPLTDTLKFRLAAKAIEGGTWQYDIIKTIPSQAPDTLGAERKLMGRLSLEFTPSDRVKIQAMVTGARDHSDPQAPHYDRSPYNVYSAASLAAANANPSTANPFGVVNDELYHQFTTPGNPGYNSTFLTFQNNAVTRMNGTNSINEFPQPWSQFGWQKDALITLGSPNVPNARAGSWGPGFMKPNRDWYFQGTLRADIDFSDSVKLTSITSYAEKEVHHTVDLSGTTADSYGVRTDGKVKAFNQELRLSGKTGGLTWIVGGNYDHVTTIDNNDYILYDFFGADPFGWKATGLGPVQNTHQDFSNKLETWAVFGNAEYKLTDQLTISGGVRYTKNKLSASYAYLEPLATATNGFVPYYGTNAIFNALCNIFNPLTDGEGGAIANPVCVVQPGQSFVNGDGRPGYPNFVPIKNPLKDSFTEDNVSFRAGLNYKFDNGGLVYATISQGYKAGVYSNLGASVISQYVPAYELGFKMPLANRRVHINAAAFYYDYTNKQVRAKVLDQIWGLLERLVNIPKSKVYGAEFEFGAEPIDGLTIGASATFMDSKVTSNYDTLVTSTGNFAVYNNMGFTGNFKDSQLPFTPHVSANADMQYEWQMGSVKPFVGGTVVYQGKSNATFQNATLRADWFEIPSYTTVDLRAGVSGNDGKWKFSVYGQNVFNKYYLTSPTYYGDASWSMAGRPVTYGASFSFRY